MKKGWQIKRLAEIADKITDGSHNPPKGVPHSDYLMLSSKNVFDDDFHYEAPRYLTAEQFQQEDKRTGISPGDVLLTIVGTIGRSAVVPPDAPKITLQRSVAVIRPKRDIIEPRFLMYSFIRQNVELNDQARGVAQKGIYLEALRELGVAILPLPKQQRIIGILDEAFDSIATAKANAEKNLQNARALFESYLQAVFTQRGEEWVEKPVAELCDIKHGFAFKSEFFTNQGDYVMLTPGNFYESGGYRSRGEKQKYYCGEIPRDYVLEKGDLLVAMTEQAAGLLGSPILIPESDKFLHNQRLGLVIKKPGVPWTNEFFFHVFNTHNVRKEIHDSASGVKVRHTSPTKIGEVVVSFPASVAKQGAIVSRLNDLEQETQHLESIYRCKLAALEELKKSLLYQAFTGAL